MKNLSTKLINFVKWQSKIRQDVAKNIHFGDLESRAYESTKGLDAAYTKISEMTESEESACWNELRERYNDSYEKGFLHLDFHSQREIILSMAKNELRSYHASVE